MANQEHLDLLYQGIKTWNEWRVRNRSSLVDLSGANLSQADLSGAILWDANLGRTILNEACLIEAKLFRADLSQADLNGANLSQADLSGADLSWANLWSANLSGADLKQANLDAANLRLADFRAADLTGASLIGAQLIETNLCDAILNDCSVYGASAWNVKVNERTKQQNLIITDHDEPEITVDNIKIAQFIYLLLNNEEIRDVIDTITSKAVLILGRFSPERKIILDQMREELRTRNYLPVMFDFEKPTSRDTIETIRTLARMAKFIIADLTEAKAVLQELQAIVPNLPSVAVRFIIMKAEREPGMFDHIRRYPWVIEGAFEYENAEQVITSIPGGIIDPVENKLKELATLR